MTLSPDDIERLAQKRAGAKLGWYVHAVVYAAANVVFFLISQYGFGQRRWPAVPMLAWGLALAVHGFSAFVSGNHAVQHERERLGRQRDGR
jgi:hypothetical protein